MTYDYVIGMDVGKYFHHPPRHQFAHPSIPSAIASLARYTHPNRTRAPPEASRTLARRFPAPNRPHAPTPSSHTSHASSLTFLFLTPRADMPRHQHYSYRSLP